MKRLLVVGLLVLGCGPGSDPRIATLDDAGQEAAPDGATGADAGTDAGICYPETEAETCERLSLCGVVNAPDDCGLVVRLNCPPCDGGAELDGGSEPPDGGLEVPDGGAEVDGGPELPDAGRCVDPTATAALTVLSGSTPLDPAVEVAPETVVTLDGTGSQVPEPGHLGAYEWSIVSAPAASQAALMGSGAQVTLKPVVPGDYVVSLVVRSDAGCVSAPAWTSLHVGTAPRIRVELTWPQGYGDVDLHYIGPGGALYQTSPNVTDVQWQYSLSTVRTDGVPTTTGRVIRDFWGMNNTCAPNGTTSDDASLDVDARKGYGPEILTHRSPFQGRYKVAVHDYCNGSGTTVDPQLRIFVDGVVVWQGSKPGMTNKQVWDAAEIVVTNGGATVQVVPLSTPLYLISQGC